MRLNLLFSGMLILLIAGCTQTPITVASSLPTVAPTQTATRIPATLTPAPPTETPSPTSPTVCSPLQGFDFRSLAGIVSNPFQPPPPGKDGDHQGVDFSFWTYQNLTTMQGLPVQSVLSGKVAAVVNNLYPYGNMVIIESPLAALPANYQTATGMPTREPIQTPDPALTCPVSTNQFDVLSKDLSVYLLYAHLDQPVKFKVGDQVSCGEVIGAVGTTGKSVNYHLHLEMRIGPQGATFTSMAHYMNNATAEEMHNYCLWRVSGVFQMLDPMSLFQVNP